VIYSGSVRQGKSGVSWHGEPPWDEHLVLMGACLADIKKVVKHILSVPVGFHCPLCCGMLSVFPWNTHTGVHEVNNSPVKITFLHTALLFSHKQFLALQCKPVFLKSAVWFFRYGHLNKSLFKGGVQVILPECGSVFKTELVSDLSGRKRTLF